MISRRGLITGLISLVAAPAIVRVSSLMPVRAMLPSSELTLDNYVKQIMQPMIDELNQKVYDRIIYGTDNLLMIQMMYDNDLVINMIKDDRFVR